MYCNEKYTYIHSLMTSNEVTISNSNLKPNTLPKSYKILCFLKYYFYDKSLKNRYLHSFINFCIIRKVHRKHYSNVYKCMYELLYLYF